MRASQGVGIVSSFVLQSDDLDEIDWEWLGGDNFHVQHNYFSKGCTENYNRGGMTDVHDPIGTFHTYTIRWTPEKLEWIIDGNVVRTLVNDGLTGCDGYPQTPMQIKLGNWVAGRSDAPEGTVQWAGGRTDFKQAPFEGYYQSIRIQDFMGGQGATDATEYHYTDRSGTWQSIKVVYNGQETGNSTTTTSSTSKSSTATSTTAASSSTAGTTLTTVTKASTTTDASTSASTAGQFDATLAPSATQSEEETATTSEPALVTGAAPRSGANFAAVVAAALLGYLAL